MLRAFLLGFLAGPLAFITWSTLLQRTSHPDVIALNFGGLALTLPLLWALTRLARRPMFLLCWFATAGTFLWAAIRFALRFAESGAQGALLVLLFPITGFRALLQDECILFPICLFIWGVIAGFVAILNRSYTPAAEKEKEAEPEEEEPEPPAEEPYFVKRPPPKPKGPAVTPKTTANQTT